MKRIIACIQGFINCLQEAFHMWCTDEDELERNGEKYGL